MQGLFSNQSSGALKLESDNNILFPEIADILTSIVAPVCWLATSRPPRPSTRLMMKHWLYWLGSRSWPVRLRATTPEPHQLDILRSQMLLDRAISALSSRGAWFFIAPPVIFIVAFTLYPALYAVFISFTNISLGTGDWRWIGLENYQRLATLDYLPLILGNTALFVVVVSVAQITIGMIMALLLNQAFPFQRTVRTIAVLPWIVPGIVVALLFSRYSTEAKPASPTVCLCSGACRASRGLLGPETPCGLSSEWPYGGASLSMILLLGALQNIPKDIYEAARIDGASRWQAFWSVTVPLIKPTLTINLIWVTAGNLSSFEIPFALTGGNPAHRTELLSFTLYNQAFNLLDAGMASAVAVLFLMLNLCFVALYLRVLKSRG